MFKINFSEASTKRGIVMVIGSIVALGFLWFKDQASAMSVLVIAKFTAGALGVVLPDVPTE